MRASLSSVFPVLTLTYPRSPPKVNPVGVDLEPSSCSTVTRDLWCPRRYRRMPPRWNEREENETSVTRAKQINPRPRKEDIYPSHFQIDNDVVLDVVSIVICLHHNAAAVAGFLSTSIRKLPPRIIRTHTQLLEFSILVGRFST